MAPPSFPDLAGWFGSLSQSGLLIAALLAMAVGIAGSLIVAHLPRLGRLLRGASTFGLIGVLLLIVVQMARIDSRFDVAVPEIGLPRQVVSGGETRVPLAPDGHFWIEAEINGVPARFMVDTGATLTAVSAGLADQAGLEPRPGGMPVRLTTANGAVAAELATIEDLRFGNVDASGIDAVIAPNLGPMNVIGMNLLSRLGSWRVENNTLILVPREGSDIEIGG